MIFIIVFLLLFSRSSQVKPNQPNPFPPRSTQASDGRCVSIVHNLHKFEYQKKLTWVTFEGN